MWVRVARARRWQRRRHGCSSPPACQQIPATPPASTTPIVQPPSSGASREHAPFDPASTQLASTEASPKDKAATFTDLFLKHVRGPFIEGIVADGIAYMTSTLNLLHGRWPEFGEHVDDGFYGAVAKLLTWVRACS